MSAPRTNVEKQERQHKPALTVLRGVIIFAVLGLLFYLAFSVLSSDESPEPAVISDPETPSTGAGTAPTTGSTEGDATTPPAPTD